MSLDGILFMDVETVPVEPSFAKLSPHGQETFRKRFKKSFDDLENETGHPSEFIDQHVYDSNVSLLAEYSKVAAISLGYVTDRQYRSTNLCGENERVLLIKFSEYMLSKSNGASLFNMLCAHNGKLFDWPFLVRRFIINEIELPWQLKIMGLKPWDMKWLIDTQELWALGDFRYPVSLDRLCYTFGITSPKGTMDGSKVSEIFYSDDPERFNKIGAYCGYDVVALVCCYCKMKQIPLPVNLTNPTP